MGLGANHRLEPCDERPHQVDLTLAYSGMQLLPVHGAFVQPAQRVLFDQHLESLARPFVIFCQKILVQVEKGDAICPAVSGYSIVSGILPRKKDVQKDHAHPEERGDDQRLLTA
jgi:hypothetical protein